MTVSLISIIMPNYNGGAYIGAAIQSVLDQTYPHWELLIADDGSEDQSLEIIRAFAQKDARVKLLKRPAKRHVSSARNDALSLAQGDYVTFLDSDDVWYAAKLEKQLSFMKATQASFSFTWFDTMDEDGRLLSSVCPALKRLSYVAYLARKSYVIGCLTVMIDRAQIPHVVFPIAPAGQDYHEDYALWLTLLKEHTGYCLHEILASYRVRPGSRRLATFWNPYLFTWRTYRVHQGFSVLRSVYHLGIYLFFGFLRKITRLLPF